MNFTKTYPLFVNCDEFCDEFHLITDTLVFRFGAMMNFLINEDVEMAVIETGRNEIPVYKRTI